MAEPSSAIPANTTTVAASAASPATMGQDVSEAHPHPASFGAVENLPVATTTHAATGAPSTETPPSFTSISADQAVQQNIKRNKRLCRFPGCQRVIKSQGHCQRHGAKAKRCRVVGCEKQAQGTHDGMCKRHWKQAHCPEDMHPVAEPLVQPPPPEGESVYDNILPSSISFRPVIIKPKGSNEDQFHMPLVRFLRENNSREPGWHRNQERRARGMFPVSSLSTQFEPFERQLALFEILLLSGGTPDADFKDLAHAWGREKGFHTVLACSMCERRGELQRKKRKDAGIKHQVYDNRNNPAAQSEHEALAMAAVPAPTAAVATLPNNAELQAMMGQCVQVLVLRVWPNAHQSQKTPDHDDKVQFAVTLNKHEQHAGPHTRRWLGALLAKRIFSKALHLPAPSVRRATPRDASLVAQLLVDFNAEFDVSAPPKKVLARRLEKLLQQPTRTAAFLMGDPKPVGVAFVTARTNVWHDGPVAMLDELYVAPDHRNKRIGSGLLHAAEVWTKSIGGELLEIDVDGGDTARLFYERHGYGCVPPGEPDPSLRYYKQLN